MTSSQCGVLRRLQDVCRLRGCGMPIFEIVDTTDSIITVSLATEHQRGDIVQGTGANYSKACEVAAEVMLNSWLARPPGSAAPGASDETRSAADAPAQLSTEDPMAGRKRKEADAPEEPNNMANEAALFHLYVNNAAVEKITPSYEFKKIDNATFGCIAKLTLKGKKIESHGRGPSKALAKREACSEVLRLLYPQCSTVEETHRAILKDVEKRKNKKQRVEDTTLFVSSAVVSSSSCTVDNSDPIAAAMEAVARMPRFQKVCDSGKQTSQHVFIRPAISSDASSIMRLITELAVYEKAPGAVEISEETLRQDGWGAAGTRHSSPRFYCFLAVEKGRESFESVIGMALFFPVYSTWQGVFCYLEDLIVSESYRGLGVGSALIHAVGNVCLRTNMKRLQWQCLKWNEKPLAFYKSLGAAEMEDWATLRMTEGALRATFGEPPQRASNSAQPSQWSAAFASANHTGSVLDDSVSSFLLNWEGTAASGEVVGGDGGSALGTAVDDAVDELEEVGGHKQPRMLAAFVRERMQAQVNR